MASILLIGNSVLLSMSFTNSAGVAVDPTIVQLKTQDPAGNQVTRVYPPTGTVTRVSTGNYQSVISPTIVGVWEYRWVGSGAFNAASEGVFTITASTLFATPPP